MTKTSNADYSAHMAGFGRLATAAVAGVTEVVEAVHRQIALLWWSGDACGGTPDAGHYRAGLQQHPWGQQIDGAWLRCIGLTNSGKSNKVVTSARGHSGRPKRCRRRLFGEDEQSPCDFHVSAPRWSSTRNRKAFPAGRHPLNVSGKVLLLVHGLCLNDLKWKDLSRDLGTVVARKFGYSPLYLHYNTGLHSEKRAVACVFA